MTSRLEDVAVHHAAGTQGPRSPTASTTGSVPAYESGSAVPQPPPPPPPPAASGAQSSREGDAYQELVDGPGQDFMKQAQAIGGIIAEHVSMPMNLVIAIEW